MSTVMVADTTDVRSLAGALDAAGITHDPVRRDRDRVIATVRVTVDHLAALAAALPAGLRVVLGTDDEAHAILDAWPRGDDTVIIATARCYRAVVAARGTALPTGFRRTSIRIGETPATVWFRTFPGAARPAPFDYDVAISFAGADRDVAREIIDVVTAAGYRVFYDYHDQHTLLGEDLAQFLQDVYFRRSRYAVVVLSRAFTESSWAGNWEWKAILARMRDQREPYLLPYVLDDTAIPGLNPTIGYVTRARCTPAEFGRVVVRRLDGETR